MFYLSSYGDELSPDTLRVLLARIASLAWSTASKSTVFGRPGLTWSSSILQPEQWNFFNHLLIVRRSTVTSLFALWMLLVVFLALWPKVRSRWCCTFVCVAFTWHTEWSNTQRVSAPTTTLLATTVATFHSLNWFDHLIYASQISTYF